MMPRLPKKSIAPVWFRSPWVLEPSVTPLGRIHCLGFSQLNVSSPTPLGPALSWGSPCDPSAVHPALAGGWPWDRSLPSGSLSLWSGQPSLLVRDPGGPRCPTLRLRELPAQPDLGALCQNHSAAAAPGLGRGPRVAGPFLPPLPVPRAGRPRLPTLPSLAFVLPSGLVAKSCCWARCSPHSGLVSLERAEVRWYSRNCHLVRLPAAFFVLTPSDRTLAPTEGPIPLVTQSPSSNPPPGFSWLDLAAVGTLPSRDFSLYLSPALHPNHLRSSFLCPMTVHSLSSAICSVLFEEKPSSGYLG